MSRSTQQGVCNALLVRYALGFLEVHVAPGAYERVEGFLSLGQINDAPTAIATAQKVLAGLTGPQFATTVQLEPAGTADMPYSGFDLGDTVTDPGETSGTETTKVVGFTIGEDTEGKPTFVPSLSTISQLRELTAQNWLTRMSNGTLAGASSVASPAASLAIPGALLGPIGAVTPINLPPIPGGGIPGGGIPGGGISAVTSTDGTVVVTSPTGPTVDLSVASGVTDITSSDSSVTVTNPTGPTVDLSVAATGYLSLTGPGKTATPGDLTQAGGFTVNAASTMGIALNSTNTSATYGIELTSAAPLAITSDGSTNQLAITVGSAAFFDGPTGSLTISNDTSAGIYIVDRGGGGLLVDSAVQVELFAPVTTITSPNSSVGGTSTSVNLFSWDGNPNTHVTSLQKGDVCFDNVTPGIWLATAAGSATNWVMYTSP